MSVLAFIFDHLLLGNINHGNGAPPISKVARAFLQCLATIQYPPDAIIILVTEFKLAFSRALSLSESQLKHTRIRALTGLLSQVLDSQNSSIQMVPTRTPVNPSHFARLLIRKGFISDLARATHSLSLNSTHLIGTVNNILKPLEVLTRIVNQVASTQRKTDASKLTTSVSVQTSSAGQTSQTSSTITSSQAPPLTAPNVPAQGSRQAAEQRSTIEEGGMRGRSSAAPVTHDDQTTDTSFLEATHESLIPLEEEEDEEAEREQHQEIISLAHELGRQRREELSTAGPGDMDIQVGPSSPHLAPSPPPLTLLLPPLLSALLFSLPSVHKCTHTCFLLWH